MDLILKQPKTRLIAATVAALITLVTALLPNTAHAKADMTIEVIAEKNTDTGNKWQYNTGDYRKTPTTSTPAAANHGGDSNKDETTTEEEIYEAGTIEKESNADEEKKAEESRKKACEEADKLPTYIAELEAVRDGIQQSIAALEATSAIEDMKKTIDRDAKGKLVRKEKVAEAYKNFATYSELQGKLDEVNKRLEDAETQLEEAVEECLGIPNYIYVIK